LLPGIKQFLLILLTLMKSPCLLLLAALASQELQAQHSHGRRNTIAFDYESVPAHDEVLTEAPTDLILRFSEYVRLVKLTLTAEDRVNVPIPFVYDVTASRVFIQEIPQLQDADYYTAEWSALNADNVLMFGYFCFSFGPDARVPTSIIDARVFPDRPF